VCSSDLWKLLTVLAFVVVGQVLLDATFARHDFAAAACLVLAVATLAAACGHLLRSLRVIERIAKGADELATYRFGEAMRNALEKHAEATRPSVAVRMARPALPVVAKPGETVECEFEIQLTCGRIARDVQVFVAGSSKEFDFPGQRCNVQPPGTDMAGGTGFWRRFRDPVLLEKISSFGVQVTMPTTAGNHRLRCCVHHEGGMQYTESEVRVS
jgi:hypothetical protein